MKKFFSLAMMVTLLATAVTARDRVDSIREKLLARDTTSVITVAHRGDWRNFPENSLEGIKSAIDMGVDIVEIDLHRTKDGHLILMHDSWLNRTTTGSGDIAETNLEDIKKLRLRNGCAIHTSCSVPTLEEVLVATKGQVMFNLDKADRYFDEVYDLLQRTGTARQIVMKGYLPADEVKSRYGKYLDEVIYMPIVNLDQPDAEAKIEAFVNELNPVAFELMYSSDTNPLPVKVRDMLRGKSLIWYNTLWDSMVGGHDDDASLVSDTNGYGYLIDSIGCRIIQTDRPQRLISYLSDRGMHDAAPTGRWSAAKASRWGDAQPWLAGCNYIPSNAINQIEMWSSDTWSPELIDKELALAEGVGFNTLRVFLSSVVWENDRDGFISRIDRFLNLCAAHGIRPHFVFFDDCWNAESHYGKQDDPKPGVHNSGWVRDPSMSLRENPATLYPRLQAYVTDVIGTYADDDRILFWDLYNEPGNSGTTGSSLPLVRKAFEWARSCNPSQPLTVDVWCIGNHDYDELNEFSISNSDIISYHNYSDPAQHKALAEALKMYNRPVVCTEYMARTAGSTFEGIMPMLKDLNIGAINWGFVKGKTNTIYSWGDVIPSGEEPEVWFHDIYRPDGTPFDKKEIELIRSLTEVK